MSEERCLLAIFAHPDDEAYGPAATLAKYARDGVKICVFCATHGEAGVGSGRFADLDPIALGKVRTEEFRCAMETLGVDHFTLCDFVDGKLSSMDHTALIGVMVQTIRTERPQVVVTFGPDGMTGHPDHVTVSQCCTVAFRLAGDAQQYPEQLREGLQPHAPEKLYYYTVPEWIIRQLGIDLLGTPKEAITTVVDVAPFVDLRLEAIRCHQSQRSTATKITRPIAPEAKSLLRQQNYFRLALPVPQPGTKETCLFQGL
jgi:LmbE family N-acetylglucosaminyl deacetylase